MIVGLTGGIGSGKSTVGKIFTDLGVMVINADVIAHHILDTNKSVLQSITNKFGPNSLTTTGKIDKKKIQQQIFDNPAARLWLESLLHPLIQAEIIRQASNTTAPYCVVEIPLLIEAKMQHIVDRILTINCPPELQLQRALLRAKHSATEIKAIIAIQITNEERLAASDDIIINTHDISALADSVRQLHQLYLSMVI